MPYIREGKLLETYGDLFDQNCVEVPKDAGEVHTCVEDTRDIHTYVEGCGRVWKDVEDY